MLSHPRVIATRGFTLIELLVAIAVMAMMAMMSWQGLDGMTRAQAQTRQRANEVLALQMGLAQWAADLDALAQGTQIPSIDWDGRVIRMTRYSRTSAADGLLVVAWSRRIVDGTGQWLRWQSPPVRTRGELQDAWQQATLWAQNPGQELKRREVIITPLDQWQLFYYRQDAWTNPLSSAAGTAPSASGTPVPAVPTTSLPDGVRLVLTLPGTSALAGVITRDWIRPTVGGNKS
jgi:general secretion pathway protein J